MHYNFEKVSYALTDLKNLMMTTDVYIEKFLPFRINKEMSAFLQFVMSEEQMNKLKVIEKQKQRDMYRSLIKEEQTIHFKTQMMQL